MDFQKGSARLSHICNFLYHLRTSQLIPTNTKVAPPDNCIAEAATEPVSSWRVIVDQKPVPKDSSRTFVSYHSVYFSGIPIIPTMNTSFVENNETVSLWRMVHFGKPESFSPTTI